MINLFQNTQIEFRKMLLSDIASVFLMSSRYFADPKRISSLFIDQLYDERFSFVCLLENVLVGFIIAEKFQEIVTITSLCVEYKHSSMGIGKNLLELSINEIRRDFPEITIQLMVSAENTKAVSIYKSFGFEIKESDKEVYFDGSDGFIMQQNIKL